MNDWYLVWSNKHRAWWNPAGGYFVRCQHCLAQSGWGDYGYQVKAKWNARASSPAEGAEPVADTTLFVERSAVRSIVIGHNEATKAVLAKIDALPIFAASDFATPARPQPGREDRMEAAIKRALESLCGDYPSMAADLRSALTGASK